MFEQAFRNIDDVLRNKSTEAALEGRKYTRILEGAYRWGIGLRLPASAQSLVQLDIVLHLCVPR
jgi:hypothetical protein